MIGVITDTHCGARNSQDIFLKNSEQFYSEIFFPHLRTEGISKILHLGDYFDDRKKIIMKSLEHNKRVFLDKLREYNIRMYVICGNHDVFYKNTNSLNSLDQLLGEYSDVVEIIEKPQVLDLDGFEIGLVPWINSENEKESLKFIKSCKAEYLAGHFDIAGFYMNSGHQSDSGLKPSLFKKYKEVWSGHFHLKHSIGNVHYLGSPFEMTWDDYGSDRGFYTVDPTTSVRTFIPNTYKLYTVLQYHDDFKVENEEEIAGHFVKVYVKEGSDLKRFDKFRAYLDHLGAHEVKVIDESVRTEESGQVIDMDRLESTEDLIRVFVDNSEEVKNKDRVKQKLIETYLKVVDNGL